MIAFWVLADTDRAEELWIHAQVRAEDLGESEAITWIEKMRAGVAWERGDLEGALSRFKQNLSKARASGNRRREADCLHTLGEVLRDLERFEESEEILLSSGAIYQELGLQRFIAANLHSLADLALDRGDLVKAEHLASDRCSSSTQFIRAYTVPATSRTVLPGLPLSSPNEVWTKSRPLFGVPSAQPKRSLVFA